MLIQLLALTLNLHATEVTRRQALATFAAAAVAPRLPKFAAEESVREALAWRTLRVSQYHGFRNLAQKAAFGTFGPAAPVPAPEAITRMVRRLIRLEVELALEFRQPLDQIWATWSRFNLAFDEQVFAPTFAPTPAQLERMRAGLIDVAPLFGDTFAKMMARPRTEGDHRTEFWTRAVANHWPPPRTVSNDDFLPTVDRLVGFERDFAARHGLPDSQMWELVHYALEPESPRRRRFAHATPHLAARFLREINALEGETFLKVAQSMARLVRPVTASVIEASVAEDVAAPAAPSVELLQIGRAVNCVIELTTPEPVPATPEAD